jgi:hypothetical protein
MFYVFSSTKLEKRVEQVLPGKEGEVAQTICTHISKDKNDQINRRKDKKKEIQVFICNGILLNHEEEQNFSSGGK